MRKILPSVLAAVLLLPSVRAEAEPGDELRRPTVEPIPVTAAQLLRGECDYTFVRIEGTITDLFRDEDDQHYRFFIIVSDGHTIYAPSRSITEGDDVLKKLIGARVSVCGTCDANLHPSNPRRQIPRTLYIWRLGDIRVIEPAPANPYGVGEIGDLSGLQPADLPRVGRRRASGKVLAAWDRDKALIMTGSGRIMRIELAEGPLPATDAFIETVGTPETDVYHVNLTRALWRPTGPFPVPERPVTNVTTRAILSDRYGREGVRAEFHGRTVRLRGIVRSLTPGAFHLEDGDHLVPVDASSAREALPTLEVGCTVEVTGVCVMNIESWRPSAPFPRINGFTLVPRTADDLAILSRPSWWTAGRLIAVVCVLVAALVGVFLWNASLQRLARRRGRELYRAQISKTVSELRIGERTRLAVELHDTISQNLTGISLQIGAATNFIRKGVQDRAISQLGIAASALDSCRGELRNCIWDLRNGSLDGVNMDAAIRSALAPYVGDTHLVVRFSIRRARISDNTAHVLIQIVRELAANAIRHGKAQSVWVAGATEGRLLRFSVTDDGTGFDPAARPGIAEGHYGLQGIRERLRPFGGTLVFKPTCGGAKAVVEMTLPEEELTA